jgi:Helicase associated domain
MRLHTRCAVVLLVAKVMAIALCATAYPPRPTSWPGCVRQRTVPLVVGSTPLASSNDVDTTPYIDDVPSSRPETRDVVGLPPAQTRTGDAVIIQQCLRDDVISGTPTSVASSKVGWMERYRQLKEFREQHGHTLVPKRFKDNPPLGNWVNKQRQQYRSYVTGVKPCSLTDGRIEMLNQIDFCWDAASGVVVRPKSLESEKADQWWQRLEELRATISLECDNIPNAGCLVNLPRQTKLGSWLDRQRKCFDGSYGTTESLAQDQELALSQEQALALSSIDPDWWMTRRQWQWECRLRELHEYVREHGDCCVPISYTSNKLLANWVSNQRKQYNLRTAGLPSDLTDDRLQRLEAIGFVWNRWEYEFDKKGDMWAM